MFTACERAGRVLLFGVGGTAEKTAGFTLGAAVTDVHTANLNEQPSETLNVVDNQVQVSVKPNQVQTILF